MKHVIGYSATALFCLLLSGLIVTARNHITMSQMRADNMALKIGSESGEARAELLLEEIDALKAQLAASQVIEDEEYATVVNGATLRDSYAKCFGQWHAIVARLEETSAFSIPVDPEHPPLQVQYGLSKLAVDWSNIQVAYPQGYIGTEQLRLAIIKQIQRDFPWPPLWYSISEIKGHEFGLFENEYLELDFKDASDENSVRLHLGFRLKHAKDPRLP